VIAIVILNYGCESFLTATRPEYPMSFSMAKGNWWEYINDSPVSYVLLVIDSIDCRGLPAAYIMKYSKTNNPEIEYFYWTWDNISQTLNQFNANQDSMFCLKYNGKTGQEIEFGKFKSTLIDNNLLPILNGKQCHTHLNCRQHQLIEIATGDTLDIQTDPQIGFFWRFDCGELVDWKVK